jgi:hypothetical protein
VLLFAQKEKTYYLPREEREKRAKRRAIQKPVVAVLPALTTGNVTNWYFFCMLAVR